MSKFEVDVNKGKSDASRLYHGGSTLRSYVGQIATVKSALSREMDNYPQIGESLQGLMDVVSSQGTHVMDAADGLHDIMRSYETAENTILTGSHFLGSIIGALDWYDIGKHIHLPSTSDLLTGLMLTAPVFIPGGTVGLVPLLLHGLSLPDEARYQKREIVNGLNKRTEMGPGNSKTTYSDGVGVSRLTLPGDPRYANTTGKADILDLEDKDGNPLWAWGDKQKNKVDDFAKKHSDTAEKQLVKDKEGWHEATTEEEKKQAKKDAKNPIPVEVKLASAGVEAEWTGVEGSVEKEVDLGMATASGSAGYKVLDAKANAEAYIGAGCLGASAGASFTAFSAEAQGKLGNNYANVHGSVSAEAGRVGAQVEAQAGLFDKNGNVNPSLYAGASAEAIVGEVSGKAGVNVLGTDVDVKGSLNYGLGAHANVGIHDGKVAVDIGATVGVGASVALEIDVSGTVNAICDGARSVVDGIGNFFGGLW